MELQWSQSFRTRTDSNNNNFIGELPGARQEGGNWVAEISDRFQYGQKNKNGDGRWVALHDKNNKPYQHRFMIVTMQGRLSQTAKNLARGFGAITFK
ncbi:hypothetical protein FSST1_010250 [Fusarium sambucinum]